MPELALPLLLVLFLVLAAEFVNGWTDAPNAIATVISTRVLSPLQAVVMAVALNLVGALITGTAVATTISKGILKPEVLDLTVVAAAMLSIVIWSTITWRYGLPTSESHALIASLTGAGLVAAGPSVLLGEGWMKVLIGLLFSTFLGFSLSVLLMTALLWLLRGASPATAGGLFSRLQLASSAVMAFSHGGNDGQKFMGAFALALFLGGAIGQPEVPLWVIWICAAVMGLGTAFGGWRILRTMGFRLTKLEPVHGFAAESSASFSILLASHLGIPVSTTHTINTSIMGVGATQRLSAVRWGVTRDIVTAWILTFPVCGILAAVLTVILRLIF